MNINRCWGFCRQNVSAYEFVDTGGAKPDSDKLVFLRAYIEVSGLPLEAAGVAPGAELACDVHLYLPRLIDPSDP